MIRTVAAWAWIIFAAPVAAEQPDQKTFASPQAAAEALFLAVQACDAQAVAEILGGSTELVSGEYRPSFLAYPAEYTASGIMTFIFGPDDVVYERDLGPATAKIASTMTSSGLDASWRAVR
jgi:hypothetical protein